MCRFFVSNPVPPGRLAISAVQSGPKKTKRDKARQKGATKHKKAAAKTTMDLSNDWARAQSQGLGPKVPVPWARSHGPGPMVPRARSHGPTGPVPWSHGTSPMVPKVWVPLRGLDYAFLFMHAFIPTCASVFRTAFCAHCILGPGAMVPVP